MPFPTHQAAGRSSVVVGSQRGKGAENNCRAAATAKSMSSLRHGGSQLRGENLMLQQVYQRRKDRSVDGQSYGPALPRRDMLTLPLAARLADGPGRRQRPQSHSCRYLGCC